jgi:hypothetical protein
MPQTLTLSVARQSFAGRTNRPGPMSISSRLRADIHARFLPWVGGFRGQNRYVVVGSYRLRTYSHRSTKANTVPFGEGLHCWKVIPHNQQLHDPSVVFQHFHLLMEGKPGPPPRFGHKNRFAVLIADRLRPAEPHDYRFIYGKPGDLNITL